MNHQDLFVFNIVNSFIGKTGNIGQRTGYIIDELSRKGIDQASFSRGFSKDLDSKRHITLGVFAQIPRILNGYRIYLNPQFNHRRYDIALFEKIFFRALKNIKWSKNAIKIAHIWEFSPRIFEALKELGFNTILDVPIAPSQTSKDLITKFGPQLDLQPFSDMIEREKRCYALADLILAPSLFVRDEIIKLGIKEDKVNVIPFGSEVKQNAKRTMSAEKKESIDFCFAGNVSPRKGVDILLQAWDDERFANDRLHLLGRVYPSIKTLIEKKSLKNVFLPGFVNTSEYFKKCDIYVFPSFLEGSSKSVYEAMASGLPCIVTPNSGSIVVDQKEGFVIPVGDFCALRDTMLKLKANEKLRSQMGEKARELASRFTWDVYSKRIIDTYLELENFSQSSYI